MKYTVISSSPDQTEDIAEKIGGVLKGGEVVVLISELGGGKTTFTRGLAKGAKSLDKVASPTFTISKLYESERLSIHHFDFYRLTEAGVIASELSDAISNKTNVIVIEWPKVVSDVLPKDRLTVDFKYLSDSSRELIFTYPKSLSYLMEQYEYISR